MITWSRHSRRRVPITRSTKGFCHGDRGAVTTSSMPIDKTRSRNSTPYTASRSRSRYRAVVSQGNASRICCETRAISGFGVTPECTIWRRSWSSTMNPNRRRNVAVGTTKQSIEQAICVICEGMSATPARAARGNGPCISRRRPGRWKSQASKARYGSEVRPTVCSLATSVGPDRGSPSTSVVRLAFPAATSMSRKA